MHFILKRDSRVFYKKNYYTGKQGYPDCNRNPESYRIPLRVFVEYVLRHNAVCFYSINSVKVSPTFRQNQTLPPYFGQHTLLVGKQMIKGDQGAGRRAQGAGRRAQGSGRGAQGLCTITPLRLYAFTPSHHTQTACRHAVYKACHRKQQDEPRPSPCRLQEP